MVVVIRRIKCLDLGSEVSLTELHIPNQNSLQRDLMSTRNILRILSLNILIEYRTIVTAITFTGEVKAMSRVLRESTYEPLQCLPEVGRSIAGCVRGQSQVRVAVGTAGSDVLSIIGAGCVWKCNNLVPT